jgi:sulfoxide reductase heme-binding subunit YedZ
MNKLLLHGIAKPLVFVLALLPLTGLIYGIMFDTLGANPAEALIRGLGDWTLRILCLTLAITPLRQWSGWHALARFRRMLGLFSCCYGLLHLLSYAWLDMGLEFGDIARDIAKRPFILVGFTALVLMLPLALTSFKHAIRWLGGKRWQCLHRLVYLVVVLGLLHFFWMRAAKNNLTEVAVYAGIVVVLLGWRAYRAWSSRAANDINAALRC